MPEDQRTIQWDRLMLNRFKEAYALHAEGDPKATFTFEGNVYVIGFAKYLIEYLEKQLK